MSGMGEIDDGLDDLVLLLGIFLMAAMVVVGGVLASRVPVTATPTPTPTPPSPPPTSTPTPNNATDSGWWFSPLGPVLGPLLGFYG